MSRFWNNIHMYTQNLKIGKSNFFLCNKINNSNMTSFIGYINNAKKYLLVLIFFPAYEYCRMNCGHKSLSNYVY